MARTITSFRDRTVLVTGASSGIGKETALAFAAAGSNWCSSRGAPGLAQVAARARNLGAEALAVPTDVTQAPSVRPASRKRSSASARSTSS